MAIVAVARKLAVIAWHMLRSNEPYRYAQPATIDAFHSVRTPKRIPRKLRIP